MFGGAVETRLAKMLWWREGDFGEKVLKERAKRGSRERNVICRKCSKSPDDW